MFRHFLSVNKYIGALAFGFMLVFFAPPVLRADEFTSSSFKVLDPVIAPLEYSTSAAFQLLGSLGEMALGTSSVTGSFQLGAGFLRYPFASTPAVSATAGDAQVALSWTASSGFLGWTPSAYDIAQAGVSGGPYTYTDVGNVLSSTRTGLTNGSTYYFVVVVKDAFGNRIASSTEVSAAPVAATPSPTPTPGSGGGSGGGYVQPQTSVVFSGRAYPLSKVVVLKDGQISISTIAGPDARFEVTLTGLTTGNYIFAVYGEDKNGLRSSLFTFPLYITSGSNTHVRGIFIAPTIAVDKSEVKRGEDIAIFGQSIPNSEVTISVNSVQEFFNKVKADLDGVYLYYFDTAPLELGQHTTKSKAARDGEVTAFSNTVGFKVGTKTIGITADTKCAIKTDLNDDCQVNLVDFSIAAFWYKRPLSAAFKITEAKKLNGDGRIDLTDLSIMAFYWTG